MAFDTARFTGRVLSLAPDKKRVAIGASSTWGLLDDDEQVVEDGTGSPVSLRTRQVTVAAGALSGVVDGARVTVGGVAYTVRGRPMPKENGELVTFRVVA